MEPVIRILFPAHSTYILASHRYIDNQNTIYYDASTLTTTKTVDLGPLHRQGVGPSEVVFAKVETRQPP